MGDDAQDLHRARRSRSTRRRRLRIYLLSVCAVTILGAVWLLYGNEMLNQDAGSEKVEAQITPPVEPEPEPTPARRMIEDFRMLDLDSGWLRYEDGVVMVTEDGGVHWREAGADWTMPEETASPAAEASEDEAFLAVLQELEAAHLDFDLSKAITVEGRSLQAKRVQPISGRVGWALAEESANIDQLLVSVDGGTTWHSEVTAEVRAAIQQEKAWRESLAEEAALYASPQQAVKLGAQWTLLPSSTYPGDAILVRSSEPGELEWEGKTYPLQPYKAGYYTYLPMPRALTPGTYTIGDQQLTVLEKKFKTQYLTVTQETENLRNDTERIQADQKKVNEARSRSAETFLFDSEFIKPIEGRLTTPYGYTRITNNKLTSTHMAIDLAAPQGTEIHATNDGVVALADELLLAGLTIYIDHGMGLFSQYGHLSKFLVKTGDVVKKGDVIGLVGSTGFSTGPHLHFTFFAHNLPANPDVFLGTTPFQWTEP